MQTRYIKVETSITGSSLYIDKLLHPVPGRYSLILWKTGRPGAQRVLLIVTLSCKWSSRICMQNFAVVRRGV